MAALLKLVGFLFFLNSNLVFGMYMDDEEEVPLDNWAKEKEEDEEEDEEVVDGENVTYEVNNCPEEAELMCTKGICFKAIPMGESMQKYCFSCFGEDFRIHCNEKQGIFNANENQE